MRRFFLLVGLLGCDSDPKAEPVDLGVVDAQPEDAAADAALLEYTEERAVCADRNPERNLYWGDLHVHTGLSFDAYIFDIHTRPEGAWRFAQGDALQLPPLDADGRGTQEVRLERPLDFAALTDHAEYLAEVQACTDADSAAFETANCVAYRAGQGSAVIQFGSRLTSVRPARIEDICAEVDCEAGAGDVWGRIQQAAEAAYDRSEACSFTSFVAYEYTAATQLSNLHRNVIFRNAEVPERPVSYFDEPKAEGLWRRLDEDCLEAEGACDVMAMPHNSNWSNGNLFALNYGGAEEEADQREAAAFRARMEPVFEIFQHKGDSECANGFAGVMGEPDELCNCEKLRPSTDDCGEGTGGGAMAGYGCQSAYDYVRNALKRGLSEWLRLGVDPFHLGIIASTDTHNAIPGAVSEKGYRGHWGNNEAAPEARLSAGSLTPGGVLFSPGGLAAAWAVENSRDALFEAFRRREVYGTSGPRIALRLFASRRFEGDLCEAPDLVARGYAEGVPMGADLPPGEGAPVFVLQAARDAGTASRPAVDLQRAQIIKGWVAADGALREKVYEVAGDPENGATVSMETCAPEGEGFATLCATWTDPDFDAARPAFYYARVVENPTCRWTTWACLALAPEERPEPCADPSVQVPQQERAWSSPIWHLP